MPDTQAVEIRRRIEEWRRTRDLASLWPDLDPAALARAHARLRDVTQQTLGANDKEGGRAAERAGGAPTLAGRTDDERRALGIGAYISGMGPLLGLWMEKGLVDAAADVRALFARHLDHGRRRVRKLRERLVDTVDSLTAEGVDPIVLKGLHTGAVYFPDPGTRPGADIDLLVRPSERDAAVRTLRAEGFVESRNTQHSARSEWTLAGSVQMVRSLDFDHVDNPWTIDLHVRLERWYFRGLRRDLGAGAFATQERVWFGQTPIRVLAQPYLAAFLALHGSHDVVKTRLVRLVELALVLKEDVAAGRLDWSELGDLVRRSGTLRFVHPALALTESLVPGSVAPRLLEEAEGAASARARRVVAAVAAANMAPLAHKTLDAKLMWASGAREALQNATELLVPSDDGMDVSPARVLLRRMAGVVTGRTRWRSRTCTDNGT